VGWIGAFEFLEDVLITEDHSTPVLVDVGFCKLQSRFLVLFRETRTFLTPKCLETSIMERSLNRFVGNVGDLETL
jgi:hypothetical protein